MSCWWDDNAQRHRSTLIYKVFYVWGWPVIRWVMFRCMSSERAHVFAVHYGIRWIGWLDEAWTWGIAVPCVLIGIAGLRLLAFLPGCRWCPVGDVANTGEQP